MVCATDDVSSLVMLPEVNTSIRMELFVIVDATVSCTSVTTVSTTMVEVVATVSFVTTSSTLCY